jgi:hypothetical protein
MKDLFPKYTRNSKNSTIAILKEMDKRSKEMLSHRRYTKWQISIRNSQHNFKLRNFKLKEQ